MQINSPLLEALTSEIHHRSIAALLTVLVLLVHFWIVILLLQPSEQDKDIKPLKIIEVALVPEPKPKPKPKPIAEAAPPAPPPKTTPPKKIPPKKVVPPKKETKPQVIKKEPVIHKQGDILKPKAETNERIPVQPLPFSAAKKTEAPVSAPQSTAVHKPVAKPGNGDSKSKGENSGVVELGCPKPTYPMRAASRHIEGWVKVELTVNASGVVTNARVADAQPPGIFDDAALDATRRCKFKPKMVNGTPVTQVATKRSTFRLEN